MKHLYLTALIDFDISERLSTPLEIKTGLFLTNNSDHLASFLSTEHMLSVGHLEATLLTNGSPVLYKTDDVRRPEDAHVEVINFLREAQGFLMATWLREDNSVNCELAFALGLDINHVHSNALAFHYTHHSGSRTRLSATRDELSEIAEFHRKSFQGLREQDRPSHTTFRRAIPRVDRGILFLQQARSSVDLGQKIANYCSFFEAVLSTSSAELSHQLAERAAFFLFDDPVKRLQVFREIKKAYGVRSKIVHGDVLSDSAIAGLVEVARTCDDISRALMLKIVQNSGIEKLLNQGSNDALDTHMQELIFGLKRASDGARHGSHHDT